MTAKAGFVNMNVMLSAPRKLFLVKVIHSILFLLLSVCVLYILYCGITKTYGWYLLYAMGIFSVEGLVLIFSRWRCPLTYLAKKYGDEDGSVTKYFCPKWFVPHVFQTYAVLFAISLVLLFLNYI